MGFALSSATALLILRLFLFSTKVSSDPLYSFCADYTANYTTNSTFENNLKSVLESLPSNTNAANGFYSTFIGDGADRVYGQALCRGDIISLLCHNCLKNAIQGVLKSCKAQEAIVWYDICQVHYSYQNISLMIYTGKYPASNNQERSMSHPEYFNDVLMFLMKNISIDAASVSEIMFAFGEVKLNKKKSIYGLVQCTRDLSGRKCQNCLNSALGDLKGCCYSRTGGSVLSRNCNMRFQTYQFYNASSSPLTYPKSTEKGESPWIPIIASLSAVFALTLFCFGGVFLWRRIYFLENEDNYNQEVQLLELVVGGTAVNDYLNENVQNEDGVTTQDFPMIQLDILDAATNNFCDENKLGEGGFGPVYKGTLPDGKEIAVKRLSRTSGQGLLEFKNEVTLIARLQHRNLVRLLGCCLERNEKLLVYEYMPNKSLDVFLFDSSVGVQLDWQKRLSIIKGIARGILYLHEDSRLRIIHRDLKASNVLLDAEMIPKISDFGTARILGGNQSEANTNRMVGTFGYMAPEYAMEGLYSVKSDVFSFGVLLLEIVSGKRNNGFQFWQRGESLLTFAWKLWSKGQEMELIDDLLVESCVATEVLKCIHVGLLCVQEDPVDRPSMSSVILMLGSETITLPRPSQPIFSVGRVVEEPTQQPTSSEVVYSINEVTISNVSAR